jgi:hypothetical protein
MEYITFLLGYRQVFVLVVFLSFFIANMAKTSVYAEFDSSGNYVCNPFKKDVETNIYILTVEKINNNLNQYMRSFPNSTAQKQHDIVMQDQKTWALYYQSRQCIEAIGINADEVSPLNQNVTKVMTVPEFPVTALVMSLGIITMLIVTRWKQ